MEDIFLPVIAGLLIGIIGLLKRIVRILSNNFRNTNKFLS